MKNVLIVAAREFRQIAAMRSFWLTLLIVPLSMAVGALTPKLLNKDEPNRVMVIARTGGGEAAAIEQRFKLDSFCLLFFVLLCFVLRFLLVGAVFFVLWLFFVFWFFVFFVFFFLYFYIA